MTRPMRETIQSDLEYDFRVSIMGHPFNTNANMIDAITVLRALGSVMAEVLSGFSDDAARGCVEEILETRKKWQAGLSLDRYGLSQLPTEGTA